jgi:tetratricopeptide (TPR) repeat protein
VVTLIRACAAAVLLFSFAARGWADDDGLADPAPVLERLSSQHDFSSFVARAEDFLDRHPDSPHAARVAWDLHMAGVVGRNPAVVKQAASVLLLRYGASVQAAYLVTTFKTADAYAAKLSELFDEHVDEVDPAFAGAFVRAVRLGLQHFGDALLSGDDIALKCAVAARQGRDAALLLAARAALRDAAAEARPLAGVLFDVRLGRPAQIAALHEARDNPTATLLERFLLARLPAEERELPAVKRILAERAIQNGKFKEALEILDTFPPDELDDQLTFWLGWCLAARGNHEAALVALRQLAERFPESEWNGPARELIASVPTANATIEQMAATLLPGLVELKESQSTHFEISLTMSKPSQAPLHYDFALSLSGPHGDSFELMIREANRTLLAYRAGNRETAIYLADAPAIARFERAVLPVPKLNIQQDPDGTFQISTSARLQPFSPRRPQQNSGVFDSEFLTTKDGLLTLLRALVQWGWFPMPPEVSGDDVRFSWLILQPHSPRFERAEFRITQGKLTAFTGGPLTCSHLLYAPADRPEGRAGFDMEFPAWPAKPVVTAPEIDSAAFVQVMNRLGQLIDTGRAATRSAPAMLPQQP